MFLLLKFHSNWADEFDVIGFIAIPEETWKEYQEKIIKIIGTKEFEYYFGTNQNITFYGAKDYLKSFKKSSISEKEYNFLLKNFKYDIFDGWNGKKHTTKTTIVKYGNVPFYSNGDLKELEIELSSEDIDFKNGDEYND